MNVLGLFARQPLPGAVKTRLAASLGPEKAARLYAAFLTDLVERIQVTGDRRLLGYTPAGEEAVGYFRRLTAGRYELWEQPPGDLGGRITAFFAEAFARGAQRAVLIGSDSPTLPEEFIERAFQALRKSDCVLGPTADGGYYLIGLRAPQPALFRDIPWGEEGVLSCTVQRLQEQRLRLHLLPVWYDVDLEGDLIVLRGHLAALRWAGDDPAPRTADLLEREILPQEGGIR